MKKILSILFLFISMTLFAQTFPDIHHGASVGNFSIYSDLSDGEIQLELFSYRILEGVTGLGLTTYIWPVFTDSSLDDDAEVLFGVNDLFGLELNWEPFYKQESFWGSGLFFRVDNYLPGGNELSWKTGARIDLRVAFDDFIYPIVSLETGYWLDQGFYFGFKIDPVVLVVSLGAIIVMGTGSEERTHYRRDNNPEDFYPNGEPRSDEEPGFGWLPETPEI